ncbi:hypothetical protein EB796_005102 [Bugula neritina]|uniref:Uncharacterized protein n=1 Tax=Bugula neritina TaxID=10212 RepID=A0A7J7KFD7_BUGNE|nr:hypothetical protein EB796_005102 [Bugula neritina]
MNDLFIGIISQKEDSPQGWFKSYDVYSGQICKNIRFKVDTGAEANVLPLSQTKDVLPSKAQLHSYSGDILPSGGKVTLGLDKDGVTTLDFELVDANVVPILGLDACVGLGIVKLIDILINQAVLDEFANYFEGIGPLDCPLPYTEQMLKPQVPAALPLLQQRQSHQKEMYDMGAKELEPLVGGDKVLVRAGDQQVWNEATLLARSSQPRFYIVDSEVSTRKNRTQLKSVPSISIRF